MKLVTIFCLFSALLQICWCDQNYLVTNDQIIVIEGDEETLVDFSKLTTVNRERSFNGTFEILEELDNEQFKFSVEMYTSPTGDENYKKMAMDVPPTGVCEGFKKFYVKFVQPSLTFGSNTDFPIVPEDGICPFPQGAYYVSTIELNTDTWPNHMPRGILKAVVTFFKNNLVIGGLIVKMKIEDNNS